MSDLGSPSIEVYWNIEGREKNDIACDADDRDDQDDPGQTFKIRQQAAEANSDYEESSGPNRIFDSAAQVVGGQHGIP
jgi:hypothetical protein